MYKEIETIKNLKWVNRSGNQECFPQSIYFPSSTEEVVQILQNEQKSGHKLTILGAGLSWSDVACTNDFGLSLKKFNRLLAVNQESVTVEAGIGALDLYKKLTSEGVELPTQPLLSDQTAAGMIATATHGMASHIPSLSNLVKKIKMITPDGRLLELTPSDSLFAACATNLGALGVVYEIEFSCRPLTPLQYTIETTSIDSVLNDYLNWINSCLHMMLWWDPYNDFATVHRFVKAKDHKSFTGYGYQILDKVFGEFDPVPRLSSEIAVPLENLKNAINDLRPLFQHFASKGVKLMGDVGFRYVAKDTNTLISPTIGKDSVYIDCNTRIDSKYYPFYQEIENTLLRHWGRPHWGKLNYLNFETCQKLYGDHFQQFLKVKKELDPQGLFSNSFTKRVFNF